MLQKGFQVQPSLLKGGYSKIDYDLRPPKYDLGEIQNNFFDFVYSDNVLEHTVNPIFAMIEQLRVVKNGGFVYTVIPNRDYTFDKNREPTPIEKLEDKYRDNIFKVSLDEVLDIIRHSGETSRRHVRDETESDIEKVMREANDGAHHINVFNIENTLAMIGLVSKYASASMHYFSAPKNRHIHIALCKE